MIAKAFPLPLADFNAFEDQLATFVEVVEKWITRIEQYLKEVQERLENDL